MYKNINAECARQGITKKDLAKKTHIKLSTLHEKLKNPNGFSLKEAFKIEEVLNSPLTLRELFEYDDCDSDVNKKINLVS